MFVPLFRGSLDDVLCTARGDTFSSTVMLPCCPEAKPMAQRCPWASVETSRGEWHFVRTSNIGILPLRLRFGQNDVRDVFI